MCIFEKEQVTNIKRIKNFLTINLQSDAFDEISV